MRNLILLFVTAVLLSSCGGGDRGQLVGAQGREKWYQPDPYGMLFIPSGSYTIYCVGPAIIYKI